MILTGVTLTGADESIDPDRLVDLSRQFPFVEWGILIGSSVGRPRFPGIPWIARLQLESSRRAVPIKMSLHLCGEPLRGMLNAGMLRLPGKFPVKLFERTQLNFHGHRISSTQKCKLFSTISTGWPFKETIVQLDGENDGVLDDLLEQTVCASGLYDRSHGAGVLPGEWPSPNPRWQVGYAGGLGPDNVITELGNIADVVGSQRFWIDMETKLRNDADTFDFGLASSVLADTARHFPRCTA